MFLGLLDHDPAPSLFVQIRIWIREVQKYMNPMESDLDPQHCTTVKKGIWIQILPITRKKSKKKYYFYYLFTSF
jgi:hypothetical protein